MENNSKENKNTSKKKSGKKIFPIILVLLIIAACIWGYNVYQHSKYHEETENAQISSDLSPVISKISGYVREVRVKDNQVVHKGDTLLILDQRDQLLTLKQAEAALGTAKANINSAKAGSRAASESIRSAQAAIATIDAQIETAKVNVWRTSEDLKRYDDLIKDHSITQQQYEQALAAKQTADRQLTVLIEQKNQARTQTGVVHTQSDATSQQIGIAGSMEKQREVDVEAARLNLSYTVILAPESGTVAKVPVQAGEYLQAGAQLFSIVTNGGKWVIANFKETQVERMIEGQQAEIRIDAFPDHIFKGVINSIAPATGSTFALLPPDNASGNFVKVVQRIPVKIEFSDKNDPLIQKLRTGMNVKVEIQLSSKG